MPPTRQAENEPVGVEPDTDQVASIRTMFGTPRIEIAPVLDGSSADEVVSNPRIAIIDDEPINIKVVQKHLTMAGYSRFYTTSDSRQALHLIHSASPDVLLLDIMMPHVSGLEVLEQLRQEPRFVDLPVIILTAACDQKTKLEALNLGATEFLGKPVDMVELAARLRNVLTLKAHQDRLKAYAWDLELEVAVRSMELAEAHEEVLACLARVGEYRDNETGNHVRRVGKYAEIIAERMGLDEEFVRRIGKAAPLHDIGKVGIPDAILLKPGKLDESEFEQMKQHAQRGREVFEHARGTTAEAARSHTAIGTRIFREGHSAVLKMASSIAASHHERWDGRGYPAGLAGNDIPLEGRIVAVADVFDALTSKRPYKEPFPPREALATIQQGAGTQFDPAVVRAFLDAKSEIIAVHRQFSDTHREEASSPAVVP
jgi:putative two-component system response regulator